MNTVEYVPVTIPTSIVKAKPVQDLAAEHEERHDRQERGAGRDDRAGQRLVHAAIDDLLQRLPLADRWFSRTRSKTTIVSLTE